MKLDDFADSLYREAAPDRLYHYSSLKGLLGILRGKGIWASEVRYLNDSTEIGLAFKLMARAVSDRHRDSADSVTREILKQFKEWIGLRASGGPMVFVASFTKNGNLLSQWRGYSPAAQGVSLGLSSSHLSAAAEKSGFSLGRCRYESGEQARLIDGIVENVVAYADRIGPSDVASEDQSFYPGLDRCEESILRAAALIKDVRFQEEDEWRIVSRTMSDALAPEIQYRVGSSMLIPYLTVSLANAEEVVPVDDVIVGPTPHPQAATDSIRRCLEQHLQRKHTAWNTQYCDIPYRAW